MDMKQTLLALISKAAHSAHAGGAFPSGDFPEFVVEVPKVAAHGDFSTNLAMTMARQQKMSPRNIAEILIGHIDDTDGIIDKTEIAGPGFINFFIRTEAWVPVLQDIHRRDTEFGRSAIGGGQKVQVEFVSSNPTGPLHVGHGRGAAVGDSVANILSACGYDVQKEYYINDSGRQIQTLGRSVYLRLHELAGRPVDFPDDCYQGEYIRDIAARMTADAKDRMLSAPEDEAVMACARAACEEILGGIREDLAAFGITYDRWFSEQGLYDSGKVQRMIEAFAENGHIYERDGARWFKTSDFGDEKDRVVVRANGQTTYFASDIAYHQDKYERGFDRVIDVWGADHHGYIPRVAAAVEASGYRRDQFDVILVQLVNLLRDGEPVAMSTRAGEFVTLKDVVDEVGSDAARFIFLTRSADSPLDFDLEVAKRKSNDNPVYYVQYVHARISSIGRKAAENGVDTGTEPATGALQRLSMPEETALMKTMGDYTEVVQRSARFMEPHRITFYLMSLASAFHAYYNKHRVLTDDAELTVARLYLVRAVQKVIANGLALLGVSAPERM